MPTLTDAISDIKLSNIDVPTPNVPVAIAEALDAAGIRSAPQRRRWPFAFAAVAAASIAGWAVLRNEAIRTRLNAFVGSIRERIATMRSPASGLEPVAFPAAETKPIEPGLVTEYETPEVADYPPGLGSVSSSRT